MKNNENSREVLTLIERSKNTNAGLGGYIIYMIILLAMLLIDTVYYGTHVWYDVDYDIYTGLFQFVIFFYTTVYLFKGTEGYRIIYGWKRWALGCVFGVWTLFSAYGAWISLEQTGEEIHSRTGYSKTEMREIRQSYLDAGYTEKDFQADMISEISSYELNKRIYGLLYIASCIGLWKWTVSVKNFEEQKYDNNEEDDADE